MHRGKIIRVLFDTKKQLPAHVASVVSATSPSKRTLKVLCIEGADKMRMFGLMRFAIAGKEQKLRGSMERIAAPGGVDCNGTDRWYPGDQLEMTFQHTLLSSSSKNYTRKSDDDTRLSGFRRLTVVLVCEECGGEVADDAKVEPIPEPVVEPVPAPKPTYLPNHMSDLVDLLPFDLVADVIVR